MILDISVIITEIYIPDKSPYIYIIVNVQGLSMIDL